MVVTPNGMVFVKPAVRKSLLAKMLAEILDTRVMIKHAMKSCRNDKVCTSVTAGRSRLMTVLELFAECSSTWSETHGGKCVPSPATCG
jgi:hypothetical protein